MFLLFFVVTILSLSQEVSPCPQNPNDVNSKMRLHTSGCCEYGVLDAVSIIDVCCGTNGAGDAPVALWGPTLETYSKAAQAGTNLRSATARPLAHYERGGGREHPRRAFLRTGAGFLVCGARPTKRKRTRVHRRGRQRRRIPASDAPKNPERKRQKIRRLKREPRKGQLKGHLESTRNEPNGHVRGDGTKEKRRKKNKHGLGGREPKTSVPCVCVCVPGCTRAVSVRERRGIKRRERVSTCNLSVGLGPRSKHDEDVASASHHDRKGTGTKGQNEDIIYLSQFPSKKQGLISHLLLTKIAR